MSAPEELHDDLESHAVHDSDFYGVLPGIAGVLFGAALLIFMFGVADGFH